MKKIYTICIICSVIFGNLLAISNTDSDDIRKDYKEEFSANKNTLLKVFNKYGDIKLENWNEDKVLIEAYIQVSHFFDERAKEILDDIEIVINANNNEIEARTVFEDNLSSSNIFGVNDNSREIKIEYTIYIPKYISAEIYNKYGGVFAETIEGKAHIEVNYGSIQVEKLTRGNIKPLNTVVLAYSKGNIEEFNWLKLNMKYSKLDVFKGYALAVESKYSKLYSNNLSSLVTESKYDTYELGVLNNFSGISGYSNFTLEGVNNRIKIESKYSDYKLGKVSKEFKEISIENKYGGIKMNISDDASYIIDAEAEYAKIYYPDWSNANKSKDNNEMRVWGLIGQNKNTESKVNIDTKYGNVRLIY